jgi:hypothetical protein
MGIGIGTITFIITYFPSYDEEDVRLVSDLRLHWDDLSISYHPLGRVRIIGQSFDAALGKIRSDDWNYWPFYQ